MTSRSLKNPRTTPRSTLRTICSLSPLLSIAILVNGVTFADADAGELISKLSVSKKPSAAASQRVARLARVNSSTRRSTLPLIAQADEPLERLRQRNAEQRFHNALEEQEANTFAPGRESTPTSEAPVDVDASGVRPEPGHLMPQEERIAALQDPKGDLALPEPVTNPSQLKRISAIQPYFDYQPETSFKGEVCWDLCPRPDGMPCKPDDNGLVPECPSEFRFGEEPYLPRVLGDCVYSWQASDLYHNPLYFEDPAFERYGHTHCELIQPFVSVGRAGLQLVGLPYQMTIDPVCKRMYALGYYRPGECAPKKYYRIPWNLHAAVAEAGVLTGLIYIFP